ncbi:hypothetical protein AVEN_182648-1 [Araneus ventricosus]|uniref:Uncharacterized protein n=1 Tax=Araneus ventricosus TaxID=182803 RepID=A0A4Y2IPF1_ARAVE|nr:hypothetical protein AVEN_182648-1 [Araneus ventricosus]
MDHSHGDPPAFAREPHSPSPTCLNFVVFALLKESCSLSPHSHFSCITQNSKSITEEDENPNFSAAPRRFPSYFRVDDGFGSGATEFAWNGLNVDVEL